MSLSSTIASLVHETSSAIVTATPDAVIGVDLPSATNDVVSLFTTTATATATATAAAATTTMPGPEDDHGREGECQLVGPFALIVQLALGGLALLSLVYKRWRERPQRPVKIWFFDVSKQVFGSVLVHIANVFMSMLTSGRFSMKLDPITVQTAERLLRREDEYYPNPCSFYLLNLAIDTTIGIPILIILLRIVTGLVAYTPWGKPPESIQSGNYGNPPNAWWWFKQSVIYFCGLFGMKICVLIIFLVVPWISRVGDWALRWTEGNERVQIVFVMMLFPLIMNAIQYYIIDSFIKLKEPGHESIPSEEGDGQDSFDDALIESDDESISGESNESMKLSNSRSFKKAGIKGPDGGREEYDPDLDGQTIIGSSRSQERGKPLPIPKELFPPE
ncbi:vacuolar membrane protein-domain-containing protein [Daldinia vernicosa]|uniref:vacuolar membrane protein-domain-containing protein n=1 Tax=Daldinia vernicosa TaxID=114800 RepID=UPI0020074599|nr:vacuolar membrane protein-domain-containing protein [Daldinia vernicosa]KAI0851474.1 vacuolar membrane protein-domain-containing protein [Daldinia vernicosa]